MKSTIGEAVVIKGDITSTEALLVNGEVEGSLESEGGVTVGPAAKVTANIRAKDVEVSGAIRGNVDAAERLILHKGASLIGDVRTAGIVIEDGAYFKGGIDITGVAPANI